MIRSLLAAGLAVLSLSLLPAVAQEEEAVIDTAPERAPLCVGAPYDQFDFWVGTWQVTVPGGRLAGLNRITSEEKGCLIVEHWDSGASTGQSYNFYDPAKEKWRQLWVSEDAIIDYEGGPTDDAAMFLQGTITYRAGPTFPFIGKWVINEDGTVTQSFKEYDPTTDKWADWFTGIYTRVPDSAELVAVEPEPAEAPEPEAEAVSSPAEDDAGEPMVLGGE